MKSTQTHADGSVHCPKCNATSFTAQRTKKVKVGLGLTSLVTAPKLRCNGCGEYLKPGSSRSTPVSTYTPSEPSKQRTLALAAGNGGGRLRRQAARVECEKRGWDWKAARADTADDQEYEVRKAATQARYEAKLAAQAKS